MMIYLYVKTHNKTGLKYLGKTTSENPYKYPGSGKYWQRHLKKHGNDVSTEILLITEDKEELKQTGLFFSDLWNVVKSDDWANCKPEMGDGGGCGPWRHDTKRIEKLIERQTGLKHSPEWNDKIRQSLKGRTHSEERRKNISKGKRANPFICDDEYREKMRKAITGKKRSPETRERMRIAAQAREARKKQK